MHWAHFIQEQNVLFWQLDFQNKVIFGSKFGGENSYSIYSNLRQLRVFCRPFPETHDSQAEPPNRDIRCYTSIGIFNLNRPIFRDVISNYQRTYCLSGEWWWVLLYFLIGKCGVRCGVVLGHGFDSHFQTSELFGQCQWVGWCLVEGQLVHDHDSLVPLATLMALLRRRVARRNPSWCVAVDFTLLYML
jgi:hypothetical protein